MASKGDGKCQRCARQRRYLKLIRTIIAYALALAPAMSGGFVETAFINMPGNEVHGPRDIWRAQGSHNPVWRWTKGI